MRQDFCVMAVSYVPLCEVNTQQPTWPWVQLTYRLIYRISLCLPGSQVCKGEIASLRWEDFDGDSIRLRAEDAKNGTARLIPLEGELVELITRRKGARQYQPNGMKVI